MKKKGIVSFGGNGIWTTQGDSFVYEVWKKLNKSIPRVFKSKVFKKERA